MDDWNPFDFATECGDFQQLQRWERERLAFGSGIQIAIVPEPYLRFVRPYEANEYGPLPEVWEDSITAVRDIYEYSLQSAFLTSALSQVVLQESSYTPPSAYSKGGPYSFPINLIDVVLSDPLIQEMGRSILYTAIAEGVISASVRLTSWFRAHLVPKEAQRRPAHSAVVVEAKVQYHARHAYPNLGVGDATIHSIFDITADTPNEYMLFLGTVPYAGGQLVYVVDDKLRIYEVVRTIGDRSTPLVSSETLDSQ